MDKEQKQNIQTEIDSIELVLGEAIIGLQQTRARLNDLRELLEDKPLDEF